MVKSEPYLNSEPAGSAPSSPNSQVPSGTSKNKLGIFPVYPQKPASATFAPTRGL